MRRVLVPLDGSDLAASMLPDARRLAGSDGELVLVRDADDKPHYSEATAAAPLNYLEEVAEILRAEGVSVRIRKLTGGDIASAIDTAAKAFNVDMIAVATHGRHGVRRLLEGITAWRVPFVRWSAYAAMLTKERFPIV